ncbi:beta-ketoacyl synthase chain length factor [Paraburkholderia sacchari]|uniref:beta-ketoacyl synthase chain length factor n=1 Tax=Paraburkholderia sacchari TaxID=159450 RepID=UPI001BCBB7F2|nr:beta-ketoacyl synthase chain length factor [Paraburkholderia sacchari]
MKLRASIESIGLIGPGLANWPHAADVLARRAPWTSARTAPPAPEGLPAAERRRTGPIVRIALAAGHEALAASGRDGTTLATVFAASSADGENCHAICAMLSSDDRHLSPTRFHNSVHNAAAGYWSIAARSRAASNVLCAHDGSFAAGLLESLCQIVVDGVPSLLIAYESAYPEPLHAVRPIDDGFGVAFVLAPLAEDAPANGLACIEAKLTDAPSTKLASPELEALRVENPAARALPLLEAIATGRAESVVIDYLPDTRVRIDVTPSPATRAEGPR